MQVVKKLWGEEDILVNEPEYCAKILVVKKGAGSSWHRHLKKQETFICQKGAVLLAIEGLVVNVCSGIGTAIFTPRRYSLTLAPGVVKTIYRGQWHQFHAMMDSEILEVSTHDDPADCERRTESYAGG